MQPAQVDADSAGSRIGPGIGDGLPGCRIEDAELEHRNAGVLVGQAREFDAVTGRVPLGGDQRHDLSFVVQAQVGHEQHFAGIVRIGGESAALDGDIYVYTLAYFMDILAIPSSYIKFNTFISSDK